MSELHSLDWDLILTRIKDCATSFSAKEKIARTKPLSSSQEAEHQFAEIEAAFAVISSGVRPHMQSLDLFPNWIVRVRKNSVLKNLEIKDVRAFCLESIALKETLKNFDSNWARDRASIMMNAEEPLSAIDQILTPQGDIRSDASEKLYRLHTERERLAREVQQTLDRLVSDHHVENMLQDKFVTTREGRWVVPVRSGMQHFLPGVIHGSSQTKQTVFMEPEKVIPMNNRLRQIEVEIEEEIERLLTELSQYLHGLNGDFEKTRELMEEADIRFAQAQFSSLIQASPIKFSNDEIDLEEVRHPLLQLSGKTVIPNTVKLNEKKKILMLSGPNAGGKTVLLKSIGLSAQMARCGLPICAAPGSSLPFFHEVVVGIGDSQSVDENLSTFAAHLKILEQASHKKGSQTLILIDEICGSTDPEEGSALARSFIEEYDKNDVFAIITSHLSPLKAGWSEDSRVLNGSLEFNSAQGRPTYQFLPGVPGDSLALQTAKRVGVSMKLIDRALDYLSPTSKKRLESLNEVEKMKKDLMELQHTWKTESNRAQALKNEYEQKLKKFESEKERMLDKEVKKAEKKVEEAISTARVQDTFKKYRDLSEIKNTLPDIVKATPFAMESKISSADDFAQKFPPGSKVHVPSLNQDGIIQSKPNSKGEVLILSNSIRLQLPWHELRPAGHSQNPTAHIVRKTTGFTASLVDDDKTLDLRGKTVDDALEELEMALDSAFSHKEDRMKIIHGHGTEALKKSVRTYLSRSVYVKKWKAGTSDQGGDGVTWVEIGE
jgi:DNA mismatch repair protein MutS2